MDVSMTIVFFQAVQWWSHIFAIVCGW